ncbi:head decoration protein [uncultured Sphingomonas sp.]|uniref:head decoration protein n=1 Tax=uncultured Sphingomonas sp. TaxID=158754 RepID=UPI00261E44CD|nr:head decoration protein [uncultured Sphingomonas sp.]
MVLTATPYTNNPFQPGATQDAFMPDQLIGGDMKIVTDTKLITGGAYYRRGTVLGRINTAGATSAVKASGANTGNGTFVLDPTTPVLANADAGTYTLRFTTATNVRLTDPRGRVLGDFAITATAGQTATVADQIKGVLTEGSTVFVVGDGFDVTVAAGVDTYTMAISTAVDGSATPFAILVDDVDTTGGAVMGGIYQMGEFNANAVILGAGITLAGAKTALAVQNIYLKTPISAVDPS